jgi:hypothetical protein
MLTVLGNRRRFCNGLTRRELLQAGGLGLLGSYFGGTVRASTDTVRPGKAKSVISIFLHGGAPTQDMWDMKPNAPVEVRGEFKPIATSAPGIHICEHMPKLARWMHRSAIVRTVNHKAGCHNTLPAFTGYEVVVPEQNISNPNHPPSMGSVCEFLYQDKQKMPAYVCLPSHLGWGEAGRRPGIYGGFLGQRYDPLCGEPTAAIDPGVKKDDRGRPPIIRGEPRVPHKTLPEGITLDRLNTRQDLLKQFEDQFRAAHQQANTGYGRTRDRAFDVITSKQLRDAFDLDREDPRLRDRYGRSLFGSSVLVARKLVEAGTQFVNVFWDNYAPRLGISDFGWDTHELNFVTLRERYLPWLDASMSTLVEDLSERGLLDDTLILIHSDFGRTPNVNKDAGRDHWSYCYSVVFIGGGIRGGTLYGESDAHAASVKDRPVSTGDVCATVYSALGINSEMPIHDRTGKPIPVAHGGRPIREILA